MQEFYFSYYRNRGRYAFQYLIIPFMNLFKELKRIMIWRLKRWPLFRYFIYIERWRFPILQSYLWSGFHIRFIIMLSTELVLIWWRFSPKSLVPLPPPRGNIPHSRSGDTSHSQYGDTCSKYIVLAVVRYIALAARRYIDPYRVTFGSLLFKYCAA